MSRVLVVVLALFAVVACSAPESSAPAGSGAAADPSREVLGRFGVREITEQDLAESTPLLFADVRRKAFDLYEAKQRAANQFLINEMITAEAAERGMTDQQLWDLEVRDRVPVPSEEEIQSFFEINQHYFTPFTIFGGWVCGSV